METVDEVLDSILEHHGIRGMKWGVRRRNKGGSSGGGSTPSHVSDDAKKAHDTFATINKHGSTDALSNQELQHLVKRINLEKQYHELIGQSSKKNKGKKIAGEIVGNFGKQQAIKVLNTAASKAVGAALKAKK